MARRRKKTTERQPAYWWVWRFDTTNNVECWGFTTSEAAREKRLSFPADQFYVSISNGAQTEFRMRKYLVDIGARKVVLRIPSPPQPAPEERETSK